MFSSQRVISTLLLLSFINLEQANEQSSNYSSLNVTQPGEKNSVKSISHDKGKLEREPATMKTSGATPFASKLPNPLSPTVADPRKGGSSVLRPTTAKPSIVTTEEDKRVRKDWGGNCTTYHWDICSNTVYFGQIDKKPPKDDVKKELDCFDFKLFPPLCLRNGWTVTRCHLLCMTTLCNRDLKISYDKYVSKDGFC